jgi:hypothetical protein
MSIATRSDLAWAAEPASHIYLAAFIIDIALFAVVMIYLFGDFIGISTDPLYFFVVLLAVIEIALVLASLTSFKKISEILHRPKIWHNVRNGAYSQVAYYALTLLLLNPLKFALSHLKYALSFGEYLSSLPLEQLVKILPPELLDMILETYTSYLEKLLSYLVFLLLLISVALVFGYFMEKFYKVAFEELGEVTGIEEFKRAARWHEWWLIGVAYLYTSSALRLLSVASRSTSTTPMHLAPPPPPPVFVSVAFLVLPDGSRVELRGDAVLGRSWVASIFPNAPWLNRISEAHAVIRRKTDGWYIEDLGSQYGTYVNGRDVRGAGEVKLNPGDVISLGGVFTLVYQT